MPFTDIFMTLVLLFSGGRKQRGGPGAARTLTGGSGGGLTCPIGARSLAKTEDPIHCPHFPQERC